MKRLQFKMIFRGWMKSKIYTLISILSLLIGLTAGILMIGFVTSEYRIARSVTLEGNWFLIQEKSSFYTNTEVEELSVTPGLAEELKSKFPEIKNYCVFHSLSGILVRENGEQELLSGVFEVRSNFGDLFQPDILYGDVNNALNASDGVVITASYARELFGKEAVIDSTLICEYQVLINSGTAFYGKMLRKKFTILAVIDDSKRSFFNYKLLKQLPEEEINISQTVNNYYVFIELLEGVNGVEFGEKVRTDSEYEEYAFTPLSQIYFAKGEAELFNTRDKTILYIGISIAIAILIIACFNYINITMTRTFQRLRQTAQQMTFGATRKEMYFQLLVETALQVLIALIIAAKIIDVITPEFNNLVGGRLSYSDFFTASSCGWISLLLCLVIVLPSLYIFNKINKKALTSLLRPAKKSSSFLITGMVVAQFAISIVLFIFVMNVKFQMSFITLGRPDSESIIRLSHPNWHEEPQEWNHFISQLNTFPEVNGVTRGSFFTTGRIAYGNGIAINWIEADREYFDFYKLNFVAGKPFENGETNSHRIVVNESLVRKFNLEDPVEKIFTHQREQYIISGVVEDFPIDNYTVNTEPLIIKPGISYFVFIKINPNEQKDVVDNLNKFWSRMSSKGFILEVDKMTELLRETHRAEHEILKMTSIFANTALLLTMLGLFGLASYSVELRNREIALRKVNGATISQMIWLLCYRFIKWILLACVIALPFAYYFSWEWLNQFVYRIPLSPGIFITVAISAILIGILTVIWQSWRAARKNPVQTLRIDS